MSTEAATCAQVLGQYVAASRDTALPEPLVARMQDLVLDTVGCGLLGARMPWTSTVAAAMTATQPAGTARVWGTDSSLSAADAVLVNGTSVHACELDDAGAGGHHGSTTVTTALALAQTDARLSGREMIRAVVAGIEVAARVSECLGYAPQVRCGFHLPGVVGAFGAAATAAVALGLDADQTAHALSTAAQGASGLMGTQHGGMGKRLAAGSAAHVGVRAAQLARHGFRGALNIFEGGYGSFSEAFSGGRSTYDLDRLVDGLGRDYRANGVSIKLWACRVPIHPALEALTSLREEHGFAAVDVDRITVRMSDAGVKAVGFDYRERSAASAQLNLRYCVAVLLLRGDVFPEQFADEVLSDPDVLELIDRVDVEHDSRLDHAGGGLDSSTAVRVRLTSGPEYVATGQVRSAAYRPVSSDEVQVKFLKATARTLDAVRQQDLVDACTALDRLPDVAALAGLLGGRPGRGDTPIRPIDSRERATS